MGSLHIADALAVLAWGATIATALAGLSHMAASMGAVIESKEPPSLKGFWALFALSTALWAVHVAVA